MQLETLKYELGDDNVATITLNRPDRLNAFNQQMLDDFGQVWRECRRDDDVHAVVLRANGDRAFCTGVDQKDGRARPTNPFADDDPGVFLGAKQNHVWKPVVCALNGIVAGGAFYLVNESDLVICSSDAAFFDPHVTYGMVAALEPIGLLRRIPFGEAMRIALMGLDERMSAERALSIGLVSEIVAPQDLRVRAHQLAARIASKPPMAVQATVKAMWQSLDMSAAGARSIPMVYPQLANRMGRVPMSAVQRPPYETR